MILTIVKYPDPILLQPGEPVTEFNAELRKLADDMFETMYAGQGAGLAGEQVGIAKRIIVIDLSGGKNPEQKIVLINPEIISTEGKLYEMEGCLSFPEIFEKVVRPAKVRVRAQDVKGKWFEMDGAGLLARCFQHEIDHLDGKLFISRMSALKRDLVQRKIRKLQHANEW
jgi:peptide deformylase